MPEEAHLYTYLTAPEYLRLCGGCAGAGRDAGTEDRSVSARARPRHRSPRDAGCIFERHAPEGAAGSRAHSQPASGDSRRAGLGARRGDGARGPDDREGARLGRPDHLLQLARARHGREDQHARDDPPGRRSRGRRLRIQSARADAPAVARGRLLAARGERRRRRRRARHVERRAAVAGNLPTRSER